MCGVEHGGLQGPVHPGEEDSPTHSPCFCPGEEDSPAHSPCLCQGMGKGMTLGAVTSLSERGTLCPSVDAGAEVSIDVAL